MVEAKVKSLEYTSPISPHLSPVCYNHFIATNYASHSLLSLPFRILILSQSCFSSLKSPFVCRRAPSSTSRPSPLLPAGTWKFKPCRTYFYLCVHMESTLPWHTRCAQQSAPEHLWFALHVFFENIDPYAMNEHLCTQCHTLDRC